MREIRTSGSVRGEEGNLLTYSTSGGPGVRNKANVRGANWAVTAVRQEGYNG